MVSRYFKVDFGVPIHPIIWRVYWSPGRKWPLEESHLYLHANSESKVTSHLPILGFSGCPRSRQTSCQFIPESLENTSTECCIDEWINDRVQRQEAVDEYADWTWDGYNVVYDE